MIRIKLGFKQMNALAKERRAKFFANGEEISVELEPNTTILLAEDVIAEFVEHSQASNDPMLRAFFEQALDKKKAN
jgi:hypothetical protein